MAIIYRSGVASHEACSGSGLLLIWGQSSSSFEVAGGGGGSVAVSFEFFLLLWL